MSTKNLLGNPTSVKITDNVEENSRDRTLYFKMNQTNLEVLPGQFLMVWVPKVDEVPMGICYFRQDTMGITVRQVGEATRALCELDVGDWIGVRGPFGSGYTLEGDSVLLVGGGIGMAPLRLLAERLLDENRKVNLVVGAKKESELLLYDFDSLMDDNLVVHICTDDGSRGIQGLATELVERLIMEKDFDSVYCCGPEMMMHRLYNMSREHDIELQASLERYMKCGCGICGTCSVDPNGVLVCKDGPVFSANNLGRISEFGQYYRDEMGIKRRF